MTLSTFVILYNHYRCLVSELFLSELFILDRGEGNEKERERNINVWLSLEHPPLET